MRQHRDVKGTLNLTMTATEQATVTAWLARCGMTNGAMESVQESEPEPETESSVRCDPSYPDECIPPPPPDLNCGDITHRRFRVTGNDPHGFDRDWDGTGCESQEGSVSRAVPALVPAPPLPSMPVVGLRHGHADGNGLHLRHDNGRGPVPARHRARHQWHRPAQGQDGGGRTTAARGGAA